MEEESHAPVRPVPDLGPGYYGDHVPLMITDYYQTALKMMPPDDVASCIIEARSLPAPLRLRPTDTLRRILQGDLQSVTAVLVEFRFKHPICSGCAAEGRDVELHRCDACQLVAYCERECQLEHWEVHQRWCCQGFRAVPDEDDLYAARIRHAMIKDRDPSY